MQAYWEKMKAEYPQLAECVPSVKQAFTFLLDSADDGKKILTCGNGGSAADSEHIVGELMKGFTLRRPIDAEMRSKLVGDHGKKGHWLADHLQGALPAISLVSQVSLITAFLNDVEPSMIFAQQVLGYGRKGDCLIALSTSGNSANVVNAVQLANTMGLITIGMTGEKGGILKEECDVCICVPAHNTARVQELHQIVYHHLCEALEVAIFGE